MKRRSLAAAIGIVIVTLACVCGLYVHFIQEKVHDESADHLKEIYSQVNNTFSMLVSDNWNHLSTWNTMFEDSAAHSPDGSVSGDDAEQARKFIDGEQAKWGFTDFYFINSQGAYATPDGERGTLNLGQQLDQLNGGSSIVADTVPTSGTGLTVFATPVTPASFDGFEYSAIAISYNNHDMEAALDVNAFDGQSSCFVITPAGNLLFSATNQYYLTYMPVGFQDWVMVGVVPSNVVNASMSEVQLLTIATVSVVLFALAALVVVILVQHGRRVLDQQVREVKYREQLFSALSGSTDNIFIMFSPNGGSVDYVSPNTMRILGIPAADIAKDVRNIDRSLEPGSVSLLETNMHSLPSNDHRDGNSTRRHQETGELRWYHETLFRAKVGDTEKLVYVLFDRTKETKSRERLQQALAIAKQSNQSKSTFLAKMSHDIRTPINAIMGMTQIARDNAGDWDKTDECLATIQTSSQHLLSLINDVLDMSKIESGAIELQEECCDLDTLLRDVDAIMRPQTAAKGQLLTLDAVNVQHRSFAADQLRVRQILLNLLSNAVKYTPDGGMVALHVEEHEQTSPHFVRLSFIVRDNGMGMPPEFIDHVFAPFERAEGRQMQGIQGTGLGMTITKALVDAMGGTIDVESKEGRGTTFTVKLKFKLGEGEDEGAKPCPCKAAESDPGKEKRTGKDAEHGRARGDADEKRPSYTEVFKGRRYLVAEDNQINRIILAEMLTERGATLEQAQNGKEAVELFAESEPQRFDAVLMDAMMPVMDGYEATRAIRKLPRPDAQTTPIVALTANAYADDVKKALDSGMNAHVGKPFKIADLAKALDELQRDYDR